MLFMAWNLQIFFVIIISILAYASVFVIDKFIVSKKATNNYAYTIVSLTVFWLESVILALFLNWTGIGISELAKPFLAGLMSGVFYIIYFYILNKEEASQIVPLLYLTPIGLTLIHTILLGTSFTIQQLLGIILATIGIVVLESKFTINQFFESKATLLGIAYGLFSAIPIAINELAVREIPAWNIQPIFATGALISASVLLFRKDVRTSLFEHFKIIKYTAVSEALTATGNIAFWHGLMFLTSPILTGINQLTPLILFIIIIFISRYFPKIIKEDQHQSTLIRKTLGITLTIVGTGLLLYTL